MRRVMLIAFVTGMFAGHLQADDLQKGDYKSRWKAALEFIHNTPVQWDEFEKATRALIKDFPDKPNGYCDMMMLIEHYERSDRKRAVALANEMTSATTPEGFKLWAKGCLARLESVGKPVALQFTALDGREVDVAKMKGKVVLVDFWATTCTPCVAELPQIKADYDKYHSQGFEVIGISCDGEQQTDQKKVERFVKRKELPWPQFYDGKQQTDNKFAQAFGVDGIPHLMLIDKKGNLRFDNVRPKELDKKIVELLAE